MWFFGARRKRRDEEKAREELAVLNRARDTEQLRLGEILFAAMSKAATENEHGRKLAIGKISNNAGAYSCVVYLVDPEDQSHYVFAQYTVRLRTIGGELDLLHNKYRESEVLPLSRFDEAVRKACDRLRTFK